MEVVRRKSRSGSVGGTCRSPRELSPPPTSASKNSRRRGSLFVRKPKLTIADYKMGSSMQAPYHRIRTTDSRPTQSASAKKSTFSSIVRLPNKQSRYSRQNPIQVVTDVETVLTDILREVIPSPRSRIPSEPPQVRPVHQPLPHLAPQPGIPAIQSPVHSPGQMRIIENPVNTFHQSCDSSMTCAVPRPQRLRLRQLKDRTSRDYKSIDDLSPEYTCLPFVKRLKILNERQKIAELQRALTVVQSTDSGDNEDKDEKSDKGSSQSTASAPLPAATSSPAPDSGENKRPSTPRIASHEGNETPERVNLKKMLRSMSGMELLPSMDQHNRMRLLRSQTVEGYALRHASFTSSSYRNKNWRQGMAQTLPSPPTDIPPYEDIRSRTTDGVYMHGPLVKNLVKSDKKAAVRSAAESATDTGDESTSGRKKSKCKEIIKEECVSELLMAIKHVLQERLDEIQSRFQAQILQLQSEVDQRDEVIARLQQQIDSHIHTDAENDLHPQPEYRPDSPDPRGVSEDAEDEEDSCYFARTFSRDSVVAKSPTTPTGVRTSPTIDELLEADCEENRLPEAINPEPLWQLEFGSCWERIRDNAVTGNPRDVILDIGNDDTTGRSSSCSTSSTRSSSLDRHIDGPSKRRRKMFRSMSLGKSRKEPKEGKESKSTEPYIPDWEVLMLAESMERNSQPDESMEIRRRAPLKISTSVGQTPRSARLARNKSLPASEFRSVE